MQTFSVTSDKVKLIKIGGIDIETLSVSSLQEGAYLVRFYPINKNFYEGNDDVSLVQAVHWIGKKPILCRSESFDYSNFDEILKPQIREECPICSDKFNLFKLAKNNSDEKESKRLKDLGKKLMANTCAASIVSFIHKEGQLSPPKVIRYGIELLKRIEAVASRVLAETGRHIADPTKGYTFEIIVKNKTESGRAYKTYVDSTHSVNLRPVDLTKLSWKWEEVCEVIKKEIIPIPSVEEVIERYRRCSSNDVRTFSNPELEKELHPTLSNTSQFKQFLPQDSQDTQPSVVIPTVKLSETTANVVVNEKFKVCHTDPFPCHSLNGGSGFDGSDYNCGACPTSKSCAEEAIKKQPKTNSMVQVKTFDMTEINNKFAELSEIKNVINSKS